MSAARPAGSIEAAERALAMFSPGGGSIPCILLVGAAGGAVRSLVGVVKRLESGGGRVRIGYILFSVLVAAATGALAAALSGGDWRLAGVAGYAGSDFLDNLCKIAIARRAVGP